jgi:D-3-phosphoglycerate dehydrogenase / 2-oxoglutarate reductase
MSEENSVVIAVGQSWNELGLEEKVLAPTGARLIDGRKLAADDPVWKEATGILLGTQYKLDAERLRAIAGGKLKGVIRYGIGYDNVDAKAATELGILVGIIRTYCIEEVSEHAVTCALALARGIAHWDRNIRAGQWRAGQRPPMRRLSKLAFGIIGYGLIGRMAALKAKTFFGRVLAYDPYAAPSAEDKAAGIEQMADVDALLKEVDIVSVHLPLIPSTRNLIGAERMKAMKNTAYIINVSRGGIVDEEALLEAVRAGTIAGAALDTFTKEPLPADHPLMGEPRILLSPHVAWLSDEAEVDLRRLAAEEIALILRGEKPSSPVTS